MSLPPTRDTIAAIATAPGAAAIGVIRLSGPDSLRVAAELFTPASGRSVTSLGHGTFTYGEFSDGDELIDDGLLLVFRDGRSYTGQEAAELQVHGSSAVLRRLLDACLARGARQAGPGEFTLRAYLNGRLDLAQAESVLDLINAESELARRSARTGLSGRLSERIDALQSTLTRVYGGLQAGLDYPDEGVEDTEFSQPLLQVTAEIDRLLGSARAGRLAGTGARLVLAGRPNSGKSSLLNALLGFERSLVSSTPGTTRDYLEARVELLGLPVTLVDTAGVRETGDDIEARGVDASLREAAAADLVIVVLDPALDRPDAAETMKLLQLAPPQRRIVVWSKADLSPAPTEPAADLNVSSVSLQGIEELRELAAARLLGDTAAANQELWVTSGRHVEALQQCREAVTRALSAPEDLAALDLADALTALAAITGRSDVAAETLEHIFANFCVGK